MDLILKVKALIEAVRAGDWQASMGLVLQILTIIYQGMNGPPVQPMLAKSSFMAMDATASKQDLCDKLEECCTVHGVMAAGVDEQTVTAAKGPLIDAMLPILLALLKKLLGL